MNENDNLTYEQRRELEQKEVIADTQRLNNLLLKMGFEVEPKEEDSFYRAYAIGKKDNMKITLNANAYHNEGKLSIYGHYPRDKKGDYMYNPKELNFNEPNISLKKTDEQIIKDLNKRFFPFYKKKLEYIEQSIKESNQKIDQKEDLIKSISEFLNIKPHNNKFYEYDFSENPIIKNLEIDVLYNNEIEIKLRANKELMFKVFDLIKRLKE